MEMEGSRVQALKDGTRAVLQGGLGLVCYFAVAAVLWAGAAAVCLAFGGAFAGVLWLLRDPAGHWLCAAAAAWLLVAIVRAYGPRQCLEGVAWTALFGLYLAVCGVFLVGLVVVAGEVERVWLR